MSTIQGGQVVARVASILRELSISGPSGIRTSELAVALGLARPTAYRMLRSLAAEGFVDLDSNTGCWLLGPELFVMGAVAASRYDVTATAAPFVQRLAALTGESAFLSVRRGDETVCLIREEGSFPVRSFVLYEGVRFPLGVASAGLAILSFLPDSEVDAYLRRASRLESEWGLSHSAADIRARIAGTRRSGFAVNPGLIVEGSWGMGASVFDDARRPLYALSVTGIESRFSADRRPTIGRILLEEAHALSKRLASPA
ncbi:IclR family transcriptional regulator [Glaciihabitans sp. UYNi722]|uniref:IclR family transcriptional regulator n=1 Tax=Glaciihabitans sp. UYNi722 TaxID=3156344 RepID=UPI0033979318